MSVIVPLLIRLGPDETDLVELGPRVAAHLAYRETIRTVTRQRITGWYRNDGHNDLIARNIR